MHSFWNLTAWSNVQKDQTKIPSSRDFHPPGTHCQQRTWKWQKSSLRVPWASRRGLEPENEPRPGGPSFWGKQRLVFGGVFFYRWWFTKSNCTSWSWCVFYTLSGGDPWKKWNIHDAKGSTWWIGFSFFRCEDSGPLNGNIWFWWKQWTFVNISVAWICERVFSQKTWLNDGELWL